MRIRLIVAGVLAAGFLLAGCATPASNGPTDEGLPEPTPEALVVSLGGVTLLNDDESVAATASFGDGEAMLELLGSAFGSTPAGTPNSEGLPITNYEWDAMTLHVATDGHAWLQVVASAQSGITIRTADGIAVGAMRPEVAAVASFDPASDGDGDGASDYLGLEASVNPDFESIDGSGQPGMDFIAVIFSGDEVTLISAPSNNYNDV